MSLHIIISTTREKKFLEYLRVKRFLQYFRLEGLAVNKGDLVARYLRKV